MRARVSLFRGSRHRVLAAAIAIGALTLVLHLRWPTGAVGQITYLVWTGGAAAVALRCSRDLTGDAVRPWRWVAMSQVCSALGDAYFAVHSEVFAPIPAISLADIGWLVSYLCLGIALFQLLRERGAAFRDDIDGLIDTGTAIVVSALLLWQLAVQPLIEDPTEAAFTRAVWASYPLLDAVLLALVLRCLMSKRARSSVSLLLASGVICWLAADVASIFYEWSGTPLVLMDSGWMLGAALLAGAVWQVARNPEAAERLAETRATTRRSVPAWLVAFAIAPLLLPAVLQALAHEDGREETVLLLGGTSVLAALAFARALQLLRNRERAEARLASSERHYRALAVNSADAVLLLDASGLIVNDSARMRQLLQLDAASIDGLNAIEAVCADDAAAAQALFDRVVASPGTVFEGELRLQSLDGTKPWISVRAVNLLDDPDVRGIVVNLHDITDRKVAEADLTYLAFHDPLTGLANRGLFHDRVEHALEMNRGPATAVMFLDLDGFKGVNDAFGHDAGDALLKEVAKRLVRSCRGEDTVARLGGDEFAILLERTDDSTEASEAIAERILTELTMPVVLDDGLVTLSTSIGIAIAEPGSTASSVLRNADIAMYEAKSGGRGRHVRYAPHMRVATIERLQLMNDLATALERDELWVAYQPVVDLELQTIVGFEALVRWEHPSLGLITPDRFIPIAEESGLIIPIGRWVLDTACRTAAGWQLAHPAHRNLTIAVNVSGRQLASSDLVSHVEDALLVSGLPPESLVLEMTESVLVQDADVAARRLRQLRRLGLRLAIDDFGTGYSSLSYLQQFAVDILKIDRSFTSQIGDSDAVPALVHGLVELGRTLELELIAEGIEHEGQVAHLRSEGCHLGQGYLFAAPGPAAEAEAMLMGAFRIRRELGSGSGGSRVAGAGTGLTLSGGR